MEYQSIQHVGGYQSLTLVEIWVPNATPVKVIESLSIDFSWGWIEPINLYLNIDVNFHTLL